MNKYLAKGFQWVNKASSFALDNYRDAKLFTSQVYNNGFMYASHKLGFLIKNGYSSNTDVYSIISKIIRTGASIPYKIVSINADGTEDVVTSGAFYDSVMNPNPKQNKFEFTEDALGYQLTTGNEMLLSQVAAGTGVRRRVYVVPPQLVTVKVIGKDFFENTVKYIFKWLGNETTYDEDEITHIKYFNPTENGLKSGLGLSPLQAAWNTLDASNQLMSAQAGMMKNRGANGLLSADGERPLDEEEGDDLQITVNEKLGGADKFNRIVATTAKVKYTQFGLSPADLELTKGGVLTLRQLCSAYGADSGSFNDPANKQFNNAKEATKNFYVNAVIPSVERHLNGYKAMVLPGWNAFDGKTYDIRLDTSSIEALQDDQNKKVEKQTKLSAGITAVLIRISEGKLTPASAIRVLVKSYEMSDIEAMDLVADNVGPNTNQDA
jgi:HK97 family phage portal protein